MDVGGIEQAERAVFRLRTRRATSEPNTLVGDVLILFALVGAGANLLVWRGEMLPEIGWAGRALFGVEAITVGWLILTAVLLIGRTRRDPSTPAADPQTTLDVLIPVATEPLDMIERTIRAAQAIEWPATVIVCSDFYMAGKDNWRDVETLCRSLGVFCLTRTSGPKGKAGNLNHALRYTTADAILTLDADHEVHPYAAHELLGWLRHPEVGFVSTPQHFVGSERDPLNPTDRMFYGAIQPARDRYGLAFSTGNGALYRREALTRIGGFSEWSVVEDLHTSIRLHDAGWKSIYHPRPISVGLAPATSAEFARQRLRWAIDSLRILRYDPPWRRRHLGFRAKLHYTHTLVSHLMTMVQIGFLLGPPAWILGRLSLMTDGSWEAQGLHIAPWLAAVVLALMQWSGPRAAFRSIRLGMAFLPMVFWAAASAVLLPARRKEVRGRGTVTNKTNLPSFNGLVAAGLALPVLLLGTLVWGVFDRRSGGSDLAMTWAAVMASLAVGPVVIGNRRLWSRLTQGFVVIVAFTLAAGSLATARLGWAAPPGLYESFRPDPTMVDVEVETNELGDEFLVGPPVMVDVEPMEIDSPAVADPSDTAEQGPVRLGLAAADGIYVGFASDALPHDLDDVDRWGAEVTEPQIVHWYQQWGSGDTRFRGDWLAAVAERGAIPMISWEAWAKPEGEFALAEQELGRMADIVDGDYDDYIDQWAEAAAEYGQPILLRPFHEMNGYWYPWSVGVIGNTAEDYVAGWRHVVDRFDTAGADNVSWVWSINTLSSFEQGAGVEDYYPGDDYVDWVSTSGFNWDDYEPEWSSWVTAEWVFADTYELLAEFDKPVMFSEIGTGTNTGDGTAWVTEAMDYFHDLPELKAIVWFDRSYTGGIDFRLDADQQDAFADAVDEGTRFQPSLELSEYPAEVG